jgi:hypothetical protein
MGVNLLLEEDTFGHRAVTGLGLLWCRRRRRRKKSRGYTILVVGVCVGESGQWVSWFLTGSDTGRSISDLLMHDTQTILRSYL